MSPTERGVVRDVVVFADERHTALAKGEQGHAAIIMQ